MKFKNGQTFRHFLLRYLVLVLLAVCITKHGHAKRIPDSLALKHLSIIALEKNDSVRINQIIIYSNVLYQFLLTDSALVLAKEALSESLKYGFRELTIISLSQLTSIYTRNNDYVNSMKTADRAVALCTGKYRKYLPYLYNNNAYNYMETGNYPEAAQQLYKTVEVVTQLKDTTFKLSGTYLILWHVWTLIGNKEKRMFYLDEAERYCLRYQYLEHLDDVYNNKAIELLESAPEQAKEYLFKGIAISLKTKDVLTEHYAYANLVYYYINKKDTRNATIYLDKWERYIDLPCTEDKKIMFWENTGRMKRLMGRFKDAEKDLRLGLQLAREFNIPYLLEGAHDDLSKLYADVGNFSQAYHHQQQAYKLRDSTAGEARMKEITFLEQKHQLTQKEKLLAQQQLEAVTVRKEMLKRNVIIAFMLMITGIAISFYFINRKNLARKLLLKQEQFKTSQKQQEAELLQSIIRVEEEERKRIAMELHDGVSSMLSVTRLNLNSLSKKYLVSDDEQFTEVLRLLDATMEDVRNTSHSLLPDILLKGGLEEALRIYCNRFNIDHPIVFQAYGISPPITADFEKSIFRLIQLIVENALHSMLEPKCIVQLNWHEHHLYITIDIQGESIASAPSNGMHNIWTQVQLRTAAINGRIEIDKHAIDGTTINLEFEM